MTRVVAASIGPFSAFKEVDTPRAADQVKLGRSTLTGPTLENCEGPLFSAVNPPCWFDRYYGELSTGRRNLACGRSTGKWSRELGQSRKYVWSPAISSMMSWWRSDELVYQWAPDPPDRLRSQGHYWASEVADNEALAHCPLPPRQTVINRKQVPLISTRSERDDEQGTFSLDLGTGIQAPRPAARPVCSCR